MPQYLKNPLSLYDGLSSLLLGNVLSYGAYFYFYQMLKNILQKDDIVSILKISYTAGSMSTILTNPFWVINSYMIAHDKKFLESCNDLYRKSGIKFKLGIKGFLRGLTQSLILVSNPMI